MKQQLSQWHSADTKPVHAGLYQVKNIQLGNHQEWAFWLGDQWSQQWFLKKIAIRYYPCEYPAKMQNKQWRGIVK